MKNKILPCVQFQPFYQARWHRINSSKNERPSPLVDRKKNSFGASHSKPNVIPRTRGGDDSEIIGGDVTEIIGGDATELIGGDETEQIPFRENLWTPGFSFGGLGYHPDLADFRDYPASDEDSSKTEHRLQLQLWTKGSKKKSKSNDFVLPKHYRIAEDGKTPLPAIENQGHLQSCTANAVIGAVEYLLRRYTGKTEDLSRMFLYKVTRRLMGLQNDSGAYIRTTIKALRLFGAPPEADWPYDVSLLDREPDAYHYSYAQNYKSLQYARLDGYGTTKKQTILDDVRKTLAHNFPVVFGFPVYQSINDMQDWVIPIPNRLDKLIGGHAVTAVGYDDSILVPGSSQKGALIIRNSWGPGWGDLGYAYLPYDYVTRGWAMDFWTIYDDKWLDGKVFE